MDAALTSLEVLIGRARQGDTEALGRLLEGRRPALRLLAQRRIPGRVAVRVDAEDVVQRTFLAAHRGFGQFLGRSEAELAVWLRRVLENQIVMVVREHTKLQKRAIRRERALDVAPGDRSGPSPELATALTSPSQRAIRREDVQRLAMELSALPEDQREAVRLRHLEGCPLAEIARRLGRSEQATAGLIKRGIRALREKMRDSG
jgi:RNA polymerase sigma-70 factor (ECF subfamily)